MSIYSFEKCAVVLHAIDGAPMTLKDFVFYPGVILEISGILTVITGILTVNAVLLFTGVGLFCLALAVHIIRIVHRYHAGADVSGPGKSTREMQSKLPEGSRFLYSDSLVTITEDSITFLHYSFPLSASSRQVPFTDIDHITVKKPTILSGKWRIWGSSNLRTWFPFDIRRPSRDRIFHAAVKTKGMNIGFTVENPGEVAAILKQKGLLESEEVSG